MNILFQSRKYLQNRKAKENGNFSSLCEEQPIRLCISYYTGKVYQRPTHTRG